DVQGEVHCEFCNISFDASLDRQVEVRFSVADSLRHVEDRRFCSGGPMNTPHVIAQVELAPGEARLIETPLVAGSYRLRSLQSKSTGVVEVQDEAASTDEVALTASSEAIAPPATVAPPGPVRIRVISHA